MEMPEYMKVRLHLYNLVARADGGDLQIPPENELCRLFDVSRVTVRGAIKGMVQDKLLIPRRGIGTFMNPARIGQGIKRFPVLGLITGDGHILISNSFEPLIAKCIDAFGMSVETLFMPESGDPERFLEVVKAGMDAVIWASPHASMRKYIDMLVASSIPVLSIDIENKKPQWTCDSITSDLALRGVKLAKHLHSLGHRSMLFIHNFPENHMGVVLEPGSTHHSYCVHMKELCAGEPAPMTKICTLLEFEDMLQKKDESLKDFSVIYSKANLAPTIMKDLLAAGLSVPEDFSYLLYGESSPYFFNGLEPEHVAAEQAVQLAVMKWLDKRLLNKTADGMLSEKIEMDIVPGETVRNCIYNKAS